MTIRTWAVTLLIDDQERLESRVNQIVKYAMEHCNIDSWAIADIDATGRTGNYLTQQLNERQRLVVSSLHFLDLLGEDGQVIELSAYGTKRKTELLWIIVREGSSVDVLGVSSCIMLPALGNYKQVDTEQFMWEPNL